MDAMCFFIAQLFQEISEETLSPEALIINMLEEVLSNCTAKRLMERKGVLFGDCEAFTDAFVYLLNSEKSENTSQQEEEEDQFMSTMVSTIQGRRPAASTPIKTELESFMPEPEKGLDDEINEIQVIFT